MTQGKMSTLSETDWQLLNAYHDDELPAVERSAFARRLQDEPALAAELQELQAQSAKLKSLRPRLTGWKLLGLRPEPSYHVVDSLTSEG